MKWSSFKYLVKQGWHSMVANRLMTLASIGVLVACLMITGVAALLSVNVTSYVDYLETLNEIVFFIDDAAPAETVEALKTQIPADGNVAACEYVPKAAAVEEMREYLGDYGDIMNDYAGEGNTENPLPASFRVSVTDVADLAPTVERIKAMGAYTATSCRARAMTRVFPVFELTTIRGFMMLPIFKRRRLPCPQKTVS